MDTSKMTGKALYSQLKTNRTAYEERARDAALLTIPQLYPPEGNEGNGNHRYPTPYQSLGSKGVNNLANKIILSLFPPNTSFFKLGLNPSDIQRSGHSEGEIKEAMYNLERSIVNEMEVSALRPKLVNLLKLLLVGGSGILYVPKKGSPEVFKLTDFGVARDRQGNVLKLVIKECVAYTSLPKKVQEQLDIDDESILEGKKKLDVYTCIVKISEEKYELWQDIEDKRIEGTKGKFNKADLPYLFVPFVDNGEDYGRSYVEDFLGDLQSYEGLRQAILEGAAESARILYLLKPNSTVSLKKLKDAKSGDVLLGDVADVGVLQADKRLDLAVTQQESDTLRQELAMTFLLDSAVQRNAERVTAEEIRRVSQELEIALGGIYSTLAISLQAPLVKLYMNRLISSGKIAPILKNAVDLEITTGSAALGRGNDYNILTTFLQTLNGTVGQQVVASYVNIPELLRRFAYSLDINTASLIKDEKQIQAEQQAAQQAQMAETVAPTVAKAAMEQE